MEGSKGGTRYKPLGSSCSNRFPSQPKSKIYSKSIRQDGSFKFRYVSGADIACRLYALPIYRMHAGFLTSIIINIVTFFIAFILFSVLRVAPFFKRYYAARFFNPNNKKKPTELSKSFLGWLVPIVTYKEPAIISEAGLDTAMFLRVTWFGIELFFWCSLWCLIVVLPVNLTDNYIDTLTAASTSTSNNCSNITNNTNFTGTSLFVNSSNVTCANITTTDDSSFQFTDFDKVSLANLTPGSSRFWVPLISVYVVTLITLWLLYRYSLESVILRIMYIANSQRGRSSHTVLVTDIPDIAKETAKQMKEIKAARKENKKRTKSEASELTDLSSEELKAELPSIGKVEGGAVAPVRFDYNLRDKEQLDILLPDVEASKILTSGVNANEMVCAEFNKIYPDAVSSVQMVFGQDTLQPLVDEYKSVTEKLDDLVDGCEHNFKAGKVVKRPTTFIFPIFLGEWGKEQGYGSGLIKKVDAFDYYTARLKELERVILDEQKLAARQIWPSAFVTFETRKDKEICSTALMHHEPSAWRTQAAPEPDELIWTNLGMPVAVRSALGALGWTGFVVLCLFFMIPVAAVQGLITAASQVSWLQNPVISKLLQGIIPGLALKIFLILVPPIIRLFIKTAGAVSENELDMGTVSRYFLFQVIVVFFGTVIAGSFFNQITQWIQNPLSAVSILGTSIPAVSTFYINYVAILGLTVKPIAFTKIVGVIIYWILKKISSNPKAADRLWMNQSALLGVAVVDHMIVCLLGLIYSPINPIIAPFALVYFAVNLLIDRYNCLYITKFPYDSFGKLWPKIFGQVLCALYLMQLTMLGLLGIKQFKPTPALIPAPFITLIFHYVVVAMFSRPWEFVSLHDAANCDIADRTPLLKDEEADEVVVEKDAYKSPLLKVKKGDADELLRMAAAAVARIDQGNGVVGNGAAAAADKEATNAQGEVAVEEAAPESVVVENKVEIEPDSKV